MFAFKGRDGVKSPGSSESWYYETRALKFYREKLEEKCSRMEARLLPVEGQGAPILFRQSDKRRQRSLKMFSSGKPAMSSMEFLRLYRNEIAGSNTPTKNAAEYLASLKGEAQAVFATILPTAAAIKQRHPQAGFRELFEETRAYCLREIDSVIT